MVTFAIQAIIAVIRLPYTLPRSAGGGETAFILVYVASRGVHIHSSSIHARSHRPHAAAIYFLCHPYIWSSYYHTP